MRIDNPGESPAHAIGIGIGLGVFFVIFSYRRARVVDSFWKTLGILCATSLLGAVMIAVFERVV